LKEECGVEKMALVMFKSMYQSGSMSGLKGSWQPQEAPQTDYFEQVS